MASEAVFVPNGASFLATELSRGPWDAGAQHGGAPAALLIRALEGLEPDPELTIARITYEFLGPVPIGELRVEAQVTRPGRRVQMLEGSLADAHGTEVVRARGWRVRRAEAPASAEAALELPGPLQARPTELRRSGQEGTLFAGDAIEIRFISGGSGMPGPGAAWFRLRRPIVAGEEPSPLQRLAAAGDFGNGISAELSWDEYVFINPDLTLYIEREPAGEWIGLRSRTRVARDGAGLAESVLYDQQGAVGRALQALLIVRR